MIQSWRAIIPFVARQLGVTKLGRQPMVATSSLIREPIIRPVSTKIVNHYRSNTNDSLDPNESPAKETSKQSVDSSDDGTSGLQIPSGAHRDIIVQKFFELSNNAMRGSVDEKDVISSPEYKSIERLILHDVKLINKSDLTSLLASLLKMRKTSCKLVRTLEIELLSRLQTLGIAKIVKLLRFYDSVEVDSEQVDVVRKLQERLQSSLQDDVVHLREINLVMKSVADQIVSNRIMGLLEEKALDLLTYTQGVLVEDTPKPPDGIDYASICDLFNVLADNERRPIPLLRAASRQLVKYSPDCLGSSSYSTDLVPTPNCLTKTLRSLISLNYHNRSVITRIVDDLNATFKLELSSLRSSSQLLWALHGLNWRSAVLLEKYYQYIMIRDICSAGTEPSLLATLVQVSAHINYRPKCGIQDFYDNYLKKAEAQIQSDQWLGYVWSLIALNVADPSLIESVLTQKYLDSFEQSSEMMQRQSNRAKYLNLRAIAALEMKMSLPVISYDSLAENDVSENPNRLKFINRMHEAIGQLVVDPHAIRTNVKVPFGFVINSELMLDGNLSPIPFDESPPIERVIEAAITGSGGPPSSKVHKCAIMYVSIGETVANHPGEVVGHRRMADRIMNSLGYKTVFIPEPVVAQAQTSSELIGIVKKLIQTSVTGEKS